MLKILLDARKLGDGGIGTYLTNLINGLSKEKEVQLGLLVAKGTRGQYFAENQHSQIEEDSRPYSFDENFRLGRRLSALNRSAGFDLFHEPHFTLPGRLSIPAVVTIHDLIHISNPEKWYYPTIARFLIRSALRRARKIIVVSEATKNAVLKEFSYLSFLESKLTVIPNAIAEKLLEVPQDWQGLLKSSFDLSPGYLFALFSMLKPHKGFSDLIEAYSRAAGSGTLPVLVVAGRGLKSLASEGSDMQQRLSRLGIKVLAEVSDNQLAALYKGARATIIPSLVEGFGLSALEAKVLGTPLLIRPLPSMEAITDSRDIICKDMSLTALTESLCAIQSFIPDWHERERNLDLSERFSARSVAGKTLEVYKEALLSDG